MQMYNGMLPLICQKEYVQVILQNEKEQRAIQMSFIVSVDELFT